MSNVIKNNRMTLYFSPRRDNDLRQDIENAGLEKHGDLGDYIKELMRDGLKYRSGSYNNTPMLMQDNQMHLNSNNFNKILSMDIKKVELTDTEAEEMFDKL